MLRVIPFSLVLLAVAGPSRADEEYKPVTTQQLLDQVPNFFYFEYTFGDEPGKRLWLRASKSSWIERYSNGRESVFDVLGRTTADGVEGTLVQRNDARIQVFIPDKNPDRMDLKFRETGKDGWIPLGEMKKVE